MRGRKAAGPLWCRQPFVFSVRLGVWGMDVLTSGTSLHLLQDWVDGRIPSSPCSGPCSPGSLLWPASRVRERPPMAGGGSVAPPRPLPQLAYQPGPTPGAVPPPPAGPRWLIDFRCTRWGGPPGQSREVPRPLWGAGAGGGADAGLCPALQASIDPSLSRQVQSGPVQPSASCPLVPYDPGRIPACRSQTRGSLLGPRGT